MLKKYVVDPSVVLPIKSIGILDTLSCEKVQVEILDRHLCCLSIKDVASVKVI